MLLEPFLFLLLLNHPLDFNCSVQQRVIRGFLLLLLRMYKLTHEILFDRQLFFVHHFLLSYFIELTLAGHFSLNIVVVLALSQVDLEAFGCNVVQ